MCPQNIVVLIFFHDTELDVKDIKFLFINNFNVYDAKLLVSNQKNIYLIFFKIISYRAYQKYKCIVY